MTDDYAKALWYEDVAKAAKEMGYPTVSAALEHLRDLTSALAPFMPITIRDTADYAELSFGAHQTQAMTMNPHDWQELNQAYAKP